MVLADDTLKLRRPVAGPALRVGVEIDALRGPVWIGETIRRIRSTPELALVAVIVRNRPAAREPMSYRLYRRWCAARVEQDLSATVDLAPAIEGCAIAGAEQIRDHALDVLVRLAEEPSEGDCAGLARLGVWSFLLGDPARTARPNYFWEMLAGEPTSCILLCAHERSFDRGSILYRYEAATRCSFFTAVNAREPLSTAPVILVRRLLDVRQHGADWLSRLPGSQMIELAPRARYPGFAALTRFFLSTLGRRLRMRQQDQIGPRRWFLAYRRKTSESFTAVPNPEGNWLADPFPIRRGGRTFVFVEQIASDTHFGHLAALELSAAGSSAPFAVLRTPYHLSYPCLIERGEEVFLLPESSENRTVELYEAEDFPSRWKLRKVLIDGLALVDTTPFEKDGVWYFFTSTVDMKSGYWIETFLFYADSLEGAWNYHPQNPICSDIRRARGAGNLFYREGRLIRPAQDCSVRYGYAIVLNEVLVLSTDRYEERAIETILPDWQPGLDGTHTMNSCEGLEVIDGTRRGRG
jgi:hypothetical protein